VTVPQTRERPSLFSRVAVTWSVSGTWPARLHGSGLRRPSLEHPHAMLSTYLPAFIMLIIATGFAVAIFTLTSVLGTKNMTPEKAIPYESGSESEGANHVRLSVKFYLTAILFVVFDIEAVFLYPWAAIFRQLGWFGLLEMFAFITVLGITLVYAWKKGALEWEK
jgi:NADH-quinone oxidoreductase subunit A